VWSAVVLAFGLAMDATAVSAVRGIATHRSREVVILPLLFGGFQSGMAALGWFAGWWIGPYIAAWDHWVAFGLLVLIGGKMVVEAWRDHDAQAAAPATTGLYLALAVATSIDAAAAGLTLPLLEVAPWIALVLIGAITAACSAIGYQIGRFFGRRFGARLAMVGGLVLIGMGIQLVVGGRSDPPAQQQPAARPAAADASAIAPAHVTLPRSPGTPPHRTTRPLGRGELARLSAIEHRDFEREDRGTTETSTEFRHTTRTRPTLGVTVRLAPCAPRAPGPPAEPDAQACPAMDLDRWRPRRDELARSLPDALRARPDTRFEIGARPLADATAIYTYQLGASFGPGDNGQPAGAYSDAVGGVDRLLAIAPPEDLAQLATAFLSFYVHEWR
jgi:putative Mn2+ efflux pump MntP